MIAIETKFHGPTNHRQSSVSATCCACYSHTPRGNRVSVNWEYGLSVEANHRRAAEVHIDQHHRHLSTDQMLHVRVDDCHSIRSGRVFPLIPCDPY